MKFEDLGVVELRAALRRGDVSCSDCAQWVVDRVAATQDVNALLAVNGQLLEQALAMDRSGLARSDAALLAGVPLTLKDNIDTIDLPTTGATPALQGCHPRRNAGVAQRLLDAGALIVGKANMHELAFGITSNNAATGAVRNPWNRSLIAGGSSGGSAASVAARQVPASIGTDTGASVRLPAALCGVVGFRPSVGRYPGAGILPISPTRDTAGPIARCVDDVMLLDRVLSGEPGATAAVPLRGLRLGVPRTFHDGVEHEVMAVVHRALAVLEREGVELVFDDIPSLSALNDMVGFPVALYEFVHELPAYLAANGYPLALHDVVRQIASPDVAAILQGPGVPEAAYRAALATRVQLQQAYADHFSRHRLDALIFPTAIVTARPLGEDGFITVDGQPMPTFPTYIRNTDPGSNAGIPGISLPAGLTAAGLPVGIELDGPVRQDERLLAIAKAIESVLPRLPAPPIAGTGQP